MSLGSYQMSEEDILKNLLKPGAFSVIVVDKQSAYFSPESELIKSRSVDPMSQAEVADKIDDFLVWLRARNGIDVRWIRMYENINESPENIRLKQSTGSLHNISNRGEKSFDYFGLAPIHGEKEYVKSVYDAFGSNDFSAELESDIHIKTLVLVGGLTSRCVLATAFSANTRGYNVILASDLVGVPDGLSFEQKATLSIVDSVLGYVIDSKKFKKLVG